MTVLPVLRTSISLPGKRTATVGSRRGGDADASGLSRRPSDYPRLARVCRMVVLQPTTLCNLDCSYCYLPDRRTQRLMSIRVAERVASSLEEQARTAESPKTVDLVWHAGEPLTTPIRHFQSLLAPFEKLRAAGLIRHQVQTNATLIDDTWCELFEAYGVRVGISVDGPAVANSNRVDWAGKPSFDRITAGVDVLRRHDLSFHAICVVTPETIDEGRKLVAFFAELGCASAGFNIEEHEGVDNGRPMVDTADAIGFWSDVACAAKQHDLPVRDLQRLAAWLSGRRIPDDAQLEPIPTVAYNGEVVLLSPELAGIKDSDYADFRAGNVLVTSIPWMLRHADDMRYVQEFARGLVACRDTCSFWDFCRGAQAGNRYFEHGSFTATETNYCRTSEQALIIAVAQLASATERGQEP